jgi:hypothetical protein
MVTIAFSPFAAIRANDLPVSELLAEFHPIAVAQKILAEMDFREFTSVALSKTQFFDSDTFTKLAIGPRSRASMFANELSGRNTLFFGS